MNLFLFQKGIWFRFQNNFLAKYPTLLNRVGGLLSTRGCKDFPSVSLFDFQDKTI